MINDSGNVDRGKGGVFFLEFEEGDKAFGPLDNGCEFKARAVRFVKEVGGVFPVDAAQVRGEKMTFLADDDRDTGVGETSATDDYGLSW